ncbi:MAG TPA: VOC family protein [Acidimicrobiales bacterium]|nr:VOC family protein [Acidimicrobiales bacterium]
MELSVSHLGICVSDLVRSVRFYTEALDFTVAERHAIGRDFAALMELDDVVLDSQFLRRGDLTIELLCFVEPAPVGPAERRGINQLGLTHLSVRTDDLAAAMAAVEAAGGSVVAGTETTISAGGTDLRFVYCTDPDGVRIELMDFGG